MSKNTEVYKDQHKPCRNGRYHAMKLVDVPNTMGMRIMTYVDYSRPPLDSKERNAVRVTDIIIARLIAV